MSKTINGMSKSDLKQLFKETIEKINKIDESIEKINKNLEESNDANVKINWDDENKWLYNEILESYEDLFWNDDNEWKINSLKNK